jgi:hypothetical protein
MMVMRWQLAALLTPNLVMPIHGDVRSFVAIEDIEGIWKIDTIDNK